MTRLRSALADLWYYLRYCCVFLFVVAGMEVLAAAVYWGVSEGIVWLLTLFGLTGYR